MNMDLHDYEAGSEQRKSELCRRNLELGIPSARRSTLRLRLVMAVIIAAILAFSLKSTVSTPARRGSPARTSIPGKENRKKCAGLVTSRVAAAEHKMPPRSRLPFFARTPRGLPPIEDRCSSLHLIIRNFV
jgi:hypothetical protein